MEKLQQPSSIKTLERFQSKSDDISIKSELIFQESNSDNYLTVGYLIQNNGDTSIKNIFLPIYSDDKCEIRKFNLAPGKVMVLPTKWLMLLLSRSSYGFKTHECTFSPTIAMEGDLDKYLKNMTCSGNFSKDIIGKFDLFKDTVKIDQNFKPYFGFIRNLYIHTKVSDQSNFAGTLKWIIEEME